MTLGYTYTRNARKTRIERAVQWYQRLLKVVGVIAWANSKVKKEGEGVPIALLSPLPRSSAHLGSTSHQFLSKYATSSPTGARGLPETTLGGGGPA